MAYFQIKMGGDVLLNSSVVPEDLSPEAAALAQAEAEADGEANGSDGGTDPGQGLIDPTRDGANSALISFC